MTHRREILKTGALFSFASLFTGFPLQGEPDTAEMWKHLHLPAKEPLKVNEGMEVRVWMRSEMTNGLFSSVECAVGPRVMGPPPHYHDALDEMMFVIEGTATVLVGTEVVEVKAGGWHVRPRKIEHTFWNASDQPLRFYDMYFNQPFEQYLEKVFFDYTEKNGFENGSEKKNKAMQELNDQFGVRFPAGAFERMDQIIKTYKLKH